MMNRTLSEADRAALVFLSKGLSTATHHVARACGLDRTRGHRSTTIARTMLRRLARWGYVEGLRASISSPVCWWAITAAGRDAIGEGA